jgi:hypothetical protein
MSLADLRQLCCSYAPAAIEALKQIAKEGSSESVRKSATRLLTSYGLKVD